MEALGDDTAQLCSFFGGQLTDRLLPAALEDVQYLLLHLRSDVFVHVGHAGKFVSEPGRAGHIGDPVLGEPGALAMPAFVEGEAEQNGVKPLGRVRVPRIAVPGRTPEPGAPSLQAALQRYQSTAPAAVPDGPRLGRWLAARLAGTPLDVRIPRQDLALLGKTPESYLVQKVGLTVGGLAAPATLWTLLMPDVPWLISSGFTLAFAAVMFLAPDMAIRSQAREAREEFRTALIAYLDLIKMARAGGAGPAQALETPARLCHGWAFTRLAAALDPARRGTRSAWDELARLAEQIGVTELAETAAIARRAGRQGTQILDTLTAKVASLREQQLARAFASAKSRTESMTIPVALSVFGYIILLGYPAYARIVGGS